MSVIMGYKTEDKIYLGADNRVSTPEDTFIRDDVNKIFVINNNVAVAFAGYHGTQTVFENTMKKSNNKGYRVENALLYIKIMYWFCKIPWYKKYTKNFLEFDSRFIVAGKNKKDECCMYTVSFLKGKLEKPSLTDRFMFPPSDVSAKACVDIFTVNTIYFQNNFVKKTVREIAKMSKLVSRSGDIWTYDFKTDTSTLEHFT